MVKMLLAPMALTMALAAPALGATNTNDTGSSSAVPSTVSNQNQGGNQWATPVIVRKLRNSLAQAGFTDIRVLPQSFLVRAKDQDGNPVMMIINPDSMTAVTALGSSANNPNGPQTGPGAPGAAPDQKHQ